jgi:hypothetical protein
MTSISAVGASVARAGQATLTQEQQEIQKIMAMIPPSGLSPFRTAAEMVEFGEEQLNFLQRSLGAAEGARKTLEDGSLFRNVERGHGKEAADAMRAMMEKHLKLSEGEIQGALHHLSKNFSVSGNLITVNDKGERVLGEFSLYGQGDDFSVLIDSQKGAFVSTPDGGFTSQFTRITLAQVRDLPYRNALADTIDFSA